MATNITVDSIQFKYRQSDSVTNPFLKQAEEVKELDTGRSKVGPVGGGYWNDLPYTDEATIEAATDAAAALVAPKLDTADLDAAAAAKVADSASAVSVALKAAYGTPLFANQAAAEAAYGAGTVGNLRLIYISP